MYKSLLNYLIASFIAQGSYFILIPFIINYFGDEAFADIELFNVYSNLLFQFFGLNICSAVTKYKYDSINKNDYLDFSSNIFGFGILTTFFSCFFSLSIIIIKPSFWMLTDGLTALLPLGVFFLFSNFWIQNFLVTLKKVSKYRNYQVLIGITKILSILLLIYLFNWLSPFGKVFLEFIFLSTVSTLFIYSEKIKIKTHRFKADVIRALKFSSPLVIYVIINNLLNYSDQIFISNYFDKSALAVYSIGYRVGMIIIIVYVALANYFSIDFYENFTEKRYNENNTIRLIIILFLFTCLILFLNPLYIEFSTNWSGVKLNTAIKINKIVILSYYINSIFLIYSRELFYLGKTFKISILVSICALVNIILNLLLLKNSTIVMAAYTTLISYSLLGSISILYMLKFDIKNNKKTILIFLLLIGFLSILVF